MLTECPAYNNVRQRYFGTGTKTMKQLLNDGDTSYDVSLYKFCEEIQLLSRH